MRLITWNCQGAFRNKASVILKHKPDILIIQECECSEKLIFNTKCTPSDCLWFGDNKHKGLGIFSYSNYRFKLFDNYNPALKYVVPISVFGGEMDFTLFAIWANNREDKKNQYVGQVWKSIGYYASHLNGPVVLTGDFNSNTIWDRKSRIGNHSDVVAELSSKGICSVYHTHLGQEQGKEKHPTFYLYKNKKKSYHLDYCFTSTSLYEKVIKVEIGTFRKWTAYSDHSPLIVEFDSKIDSRQLDTPTT